MSFLFLSVFTFLLSSHQFSTFSNLGRVKNIYWSASAGGLLYATEQSQVAWSGRMLLEPVLYSGWSRSCTVAVLLWDRDEQLLARDLPLHHSPHLSAGLQDQAEFTEEQQARYAVTDFLSSPGGIRDYEENWQLALVEKAQSQAQSKPHWQINFIYKHTNFRISALKSTRTTGPKDRSSLTSITRTTIANVTNTALSLFESPVASSG